MQLAMDRASRIRSSHKARGHTASVCVEADWSVERKGQKQYVVCSERAGV
jgi:hypothetical protein